MQPVPLHLSKLRASLLQASRLRPGGTRTPKLGKDGQPPANADSDQTVRECQPGQAGTSWPKSRTVSVLTPPNTTASLELPSQCRPGGTRAQKHDKSGQTLAMADQILSESQRWDQSEVPSLGWSKSVLAVSLRAARPY